MTPYEKACWDLARFLAGFRVPHDDKGSNTPEDARLMQGRNGDRWDNYDSREDGAA
jgi:hypothetical protein